MEKIETIQVIKDRRCSRNFTSKPVAADILKDLVDCGRLAPSGHNKQARSFLVLTDREKINGVGEIATWGKFMIDKAPACILVFCDQEDSATLVEDGSAATENILLAATAYGLASCWVAGYGMPYAQEVEKYVKAPSNAKVVAIIPLGYPVDSNQQLPARPSLDAVITWNSF